jgi:hypothetical protein
MRVKRNYSDIQTIASKQGIESQLDRDKLTSCEYTIVGLFHFGEYHVLYTASKSFAQMFCKNTSVLKMYRAGKEVTIEYDLFR